MKCDSSSTTVVHWGVFRDNSGNRVGAGQDCQLPQLFAVDTHVQRLTNSPFRRELAKRVSSSRWIPRSNGAGQDGQIFQIVVDRLMKMESES
jgi:hypothetical protein